MRRDSDIDLLIVAEGLPKGRLKRQELFEEVCPKLLKRSEMEFQTKALLNCLF